MITKEKIEKIVHDLNGLFEKPTISENFKGYAWEEVYNAIGDALAIELSCKLLVCAISDMKRGHFLSASVESVRNSVRKMADLLDKELEARQIEFDAEILVGNIDFECF